MEGVNGQRIFVGLSGGVDSAVSAALLQRAGAQVTGVFIKGWYPPDMPCTWATDWRDAMRVAARLEIPFVTLDASVEYKKSVIDYLIAEYRVGRTPNPDVMCNREVKFGAFYRYALVHGADRIAMGHYRKGDKDQSYFLWAVPKEVLAQTIFPVGDRRKEDVRALAGQFNLPVATKKDSQGVCFLGSVSVEEFLKNEFGETSGKALDQEGNEVGTHNSVLLHTIGERLPLAGGPWYVRSKDLARNILTVSKEQQHEAGARTEISFTEANWHEEPRGELTAQLRYRGPRVRGRVVDNTFAPEETLREAPSPGQSIVFCHGGELVGGGIIS